MNNKPDFFLLAALARNTMSYLNWYQYTSAASILDQHPEDDEETAKAQLNLDLYLFNHDCSGIVFW